MMVFLINIVLFLAALIGLVLMVLGMVNLAEALRDRLVSWWNRFNQEYEAQLEAEIEARVAKRLRAVMAEATKLEAERDHLALEMAKVADRASEKPASRK